MLEARKIMSPRDKEEKTASHLSESINHELENQSHLDDLLRLREEYETLSRDY